MNGMMNMQQQQQQQQQPGPQQYINQQVRWIKVFYINFLKINKNI